MFCEVFSQNILASFRLPLFIPFFLVKITAAILSTKKKQCVLFEISKIN